MIKYILGISLLFILACKDSSDCDLDNPEIDFPLLSIETTNDSEEISKYNYSDASIELKSIHESENISLDVEIRGRGNSTWGFPKKPYQLKFEDKESLLSLPADRRWILLANYSDKTLLRNELAFNMSRFSSLDWTPESQYLELMLNNEYLGVYQLTQKVEESVNRVDIGDEGYLLEVDQIERLDDDDVYFETGEYLFNVKEPKLDFGDDRFNEIKAFIELTEEVLFGSEFADSTDGYAKYLDVSSFVDWYLINEISKNNDAIFYSSVYLNYIPGGKLKMGPVWDFDISLGNINYNNNETAEGFWIKDAAWYARLFEDPNFVELVKARFSEFYNNKNQFLEQLDADALAIERARDRNFDKWPILGEYVWPNYVYFDTYDEELEYLKMWFVDRLEWLNVAIDEL